MTNNFKANKGSYNKPQLSPEEWAAKKQAEKDSVYTLIDETALEVTASPEKFKAFLDIPISAATASAVLRLSPVSI